MLRNVVFVCCVAVILTACPEESPYETLRFVNQSNEDIVWTLKLERSGEWYKSPSSPWCHNKGCEYGVILREESYDHRLYSDGVKINLKMGWIKYYLFNYDSVKTIPWQRICDERIMLKEVRFDTWDDFENCNFEITYP